MIRRARNQRGDALVSVVWTVGLVIGTAIALKIGFDIDLLTYIGDAADWGSAWIERKF